LNLSNYDLTDADFRSSVLVGTKFNYCILRSANFSKASLKFVDFYGSDLSDADFSSSTAASVAFENAILHNMNMVNCNITDCMFDNLLQEPARVNASDLFTEPLHVSRDDHMQENVTRMYAPRTDLHTNKLDLEDKDAAVPHSGFWTGFGRTDASSLTRDATTSHTVFDASSLFFGLRSANEIVDVPEEEFKTIELAEDVVPLSSLVPTSSNWTVKASVTKKIPPKRWKKSYGSGTVANVDIIDKEGIQMRIAMFDRAVDKFYALFEIGSVYLISNAKIQAANQQYTGYLSNKYQMILDENRSDVRINLTKL